MQARAEREGSSENRVRRESKKKKIGKENEEIQGRVVPRRLSKGVRNGRRRILDVRC